MYVFFKMLEKYQEWVKIQHICKNLGVNKCCYFFMWNPEAVAQRCSIKNVFLEISQNSQEYLFFNKVADWGLCFTVNFAKFLRTPFLKEHHRWLLLWNLWTTLLKCHIQGLLLSDTMSCACHTAHKWNFL